MVQEDEYIDYQAVKPSRLHSPVVQERCKIGAKSEGEVIIVGENRSLVDWNRVRKTWHQSRPALVLASKIASLTLVAAAGLAGFVFLIYQIGLAIADLFAAIGAAVVSSAPFIVRGGLFLLFVLVLVYVVKNTRRARPFDDWKKTPKANTQATNTNRTIVINQVVNINNKPAD